MSRDRGYQKQYVCQPVSVHAVVPQLALHALPALAFDHAQILADYFKWRRTGERPPAAR